MNFFTGRSILSFETEGAVTNGPQDIRERPSSSAEWRPLFYKLSLPHLQVSHQDFHSFQSSLSTWMRLTTRWGSAKNGDNTSQERTPSSMLCPPGFLGLGWGDSRGSRSRKTVHPPSRVRKCGPHSVDLCWRAEF